MNIKTKLRSLLGDIIVKREVNNFKDIVLNRQAIKNILVDDSVQLSTPNINKGFGYYRILASNDSNANEIQGLISKYKDQLNVSHIYTIDRLIDYPFRPKEAPLYKKSVIVKFKPETLVESALFSNQNVDNLKREVLEGQKPERVVIDFSSPNIAKPFHYGHLKSTILGNFLANLNQFLGHHVTKLNYIGDWGTQYGLLSLGLDEHGGEQTTSLNGDGSSALRHLVKIYVIANERGRNDYAFYSEAKRRFLEMDERTNPEQYKKWKSIRDISLNELKSSYSRLNIYFDEYEYESDYAKSSIDLVLQTMRDKHNFIHQLEDGVLVAKVEKNNKPHHVPILKSDGSSLYLTRDLAAAISRKERLEFDRMLYIVGADQEKHFHSLSEIIKNLNLNWYNQLIHVKMGKVLGMSSRLGKTILLSDIIDEATMQFVQSTKSTPTSKVAQSEDLDEIVIEDVGRQLALAALFVYDMRNARTKNYEFDWASVMQPNNRSGINLQTTFARLSSLLNRAASYGLLPYESMNELNIEGINCEEGLSLLSQLGELDMELHSSYWSMDAAPLINYALKLCRAINRARKSTDLWVLGEPKEEFSRTRLTLFKRSHEQLKLIIKLIGLKPLYKV